MDGDKKAKATIIEQPETRRAAKEASKKRLIARLKVAGVATVIISAGVLVYLQLTKPALQIGSTKISKQQYEKLIQEAGTSKLPNAGAQELAAKRSPVDVIIEVEKYKIVAKELNIEVTDEAVAKNAALEYALDTKEPNEWQKLTSYKAAFDGAMIEAQTASKKIGIYHFGFGRYVDSNELKPTDPKFGNEQEIAKDRAYAELKAKEYREAILQKKLDPDKAIKQIIADPRLGFGSAGNRSRRTLVSDQGFIVKTGGGSSGEFLGTDELVALKKLKMGEMSEVKVNNAKLTAKPTDKEPRYGDIGFYFIQLEKEFESRANLQEQIDGKLKDIVVKKNV